MNGKKKKNILYNTYYYTAATLKIGPYLQSCRQLPETWAILIIAL
jgi:hypothetical protein